MHKYFIIFCFYILIFFLQYSNENEFIMYDNL